MIGVFGMQGTPKTASRIDGFANQEPQNPNVIQNRIFSMDIKI
jgi:hypothetical protein